MDYGVTSMTAPLRRVAVRPPAPASDFARAHWAQPLDVDLLIDQHAIRLPIAAIMPARDYEYALPASPVSSGVEKVS